MKKFLSQLVDFDMTLYEVHDENHDPVKNITDFWTKYDIKSFREYMLELLTVYNGNPDHAKLLFNTDQMHEFIIALLRMYMAYHMVSNRNMDLAEIDYSVLANSTNNQQELAMGKKIFDVFKQFPKTNNK